jgi:hypothetical protein
MNPFCRESLKSSGTRGARSFVKHVAVLEPRLEVSRRGLHHHRWFIPLGLHTPDTISSKVINQAQPMDTYRADVNVRTLEVLALEPQDRF